MLFLFCYFGVVLFVFVFLFLCAFFVSVSRENHAFPCNSSVWGFNVESIFVSHFSFCFFAFVFVFIFLFKMFLYLLFFLFFQFLVLFVLNQD